MRNVNYELRSAAAEGDEELVKTLLLDPKCNPKDTDGRGKTALINAAFHSHALCVQLLLPVSDALAKDTEGGAR